MNRSIRLKLTLWYVGILTAILCVFGWVLYYRIASSRIQDLDQKLNLLADGVNDTLYAFWQAEWEAQHPLPSTPARTLEKEIEEGKFAALVHRWAQDTDELEAENPVQLIDRNGISLIASKSFKQLSNYLSRAVVERARHGKPVYQTFSLQNGRMRLLTWPVLESGRVLYLVSVAASLKQVDAGLEHLRRWLLWFIPLTLAIASSVGWFLATTALKPVGKMIAQAQRIGAEQLHERIDAPGTGDELEQLAKTFNAMLARLEQAFRRIRQFSAAASHELRTPLTVMKGELEVALRRPREVPEYQRVLRTQLEALNEMASTVEQLLTLARSEGGKGAVESMPVEMGALSRQTCDAWQTVAEAKNIRVEVLTDGSVWVRGERTLLGRLIGNLLDNALQHTQPKGRVTVQVAPFGGEACLVVRDDGQGIPPQELPNIFEKFFARPSAGVPGRSTGIGLGLCRWIAEVHQGRIEVSSELGKGSAFTVYLPMTNSS